MTYQNPQILYFLFAIAIPIIIHLFNFRKHKVVYFSSIRFLKEINEEKKAVSTIKQYLILLSRILAIAAIVLAFANPYIPNSDNTLFNKNTIIYIDNSFSMDDISEKGRLLDIAKEKALQIVESESEENNFWIITNNFSSTENINKNKKESEKYISSVESSPFVKSKEDIINKISSLISENHTLYLISDFQKSSTILENINTKNTTTKLILVPLEKAINNNISIDSCYINSPINNLGDNTEITAIITNHSDKDLSEIILSLSLNKKHKTQENISILATETKKVTLNFVIDKSGINNGLLSVDDHPITFDDKLYFSFHVKNKINAAVISDKKENNNINKLYQNDESIQYTKLNINQMDYQKMEEQDFVILNEINSLSSGFKNNIISFISGGGIISIIPPKNIDFDQYKIFLSELETDYFIKNDSTSIRISSLNKNHELFTNVFNNKTIRKDINLPSIFYHYSLSESKNTIKENIFLMENNSSFLNHYKSKSGEIYLFNSPLSEGCNNFTKHALFVTTFYKMALNSGRLNNLYYTIFSNQSIKLPKTHNDSENIFHLKSDNTDVISQYKSEGNKSYLLIHNQISEAKHYNLTKGEELLSAVSFNYSREESNTEQYKTEELENFIRANNIDNISIFSSLKSITENIKNLDKNKEYWKLFILLSLLFITLEILLIKTIKT